MLRTKLKSPALILFPFLARTRRWQFASLMDMQKCLQKNPKKMNATYHLPWWCTRSLSLPPTFPFRFGTMGTPLRVQVWGRITENTPRWVSRLLLESVLFYFTVFCYFLSNYLCISVTLLNMYYALEIMGSLLSFLGLCGATTLCHEYVCTYVCASMHLCVSNWHCVYL